MKSLKESLFDSKNQTMESLFDKDLVKKDIPAKKLIDILKGRVISVTTSTGVPLHKLFDIDTIKEWKSKYHDDILPTKRYLSKYRKETSILNGLICYVLDNVYVTPDTKPNFGWDEATVAINKVSKVPLKTGFYMHIFGNNIVAYVMYISEYVVRIEVDLNKEKYNSSFVGESLFDKDLTKHPILSLFNIVKDHVFAVKRYEYTKNSLHKFIDDTIMNRVWKKTGSPLMNTTHISPSSLSGYENKVLSTILNHIVIDKNGEFDNDELNRWLENEGILKSVESMTSPERKADPMDVYTKVFFINPREKGAWIHKNFREGPIAKECYEIEIQFKYKENNGLALAIYICLNIKWNKMDEILGKL